MGLFAVAIFWVMGLNAVRGFDFRLHSITIEEDGFTREQSYFENSDHSRVMISLPRGWTQDATDAALTLTRPASAGCLIRLETSNLAPGLPFEAKALETYRSKALLSIPKDATAVRIVEEHADPLPIFHWKSYEFVIDYEYFGEACRRSVLFLDLNAKEQLVVTSLAPKAGYEQVHQSSFDLLRSWQVEPVK